MLDRALQVRVGFAEVRAAHYRTLGTRGSERAGELLRAAATGPRPPANDCSSDCSKNGRADGWRVNYPWNPADGSTTIDVAFVRELLAIEIDGWAWHHHPERFQRDRRKQNDLTRAGWTVLRFTWFDLTNRPADVIRDVQDAIARARTSR